MTAPTRITPPAEPTRKPRRDAFDGERKRAFLDALGKRGCLRDAARKARVSHQTVYNHQRSDPEFMRQCELALSMAGTDIELHAWERGVVGVEEPIVYRGEIVGTRMKRSDAMLRLLLQGAKPKKYGPNPGFTRKRLYKFEKKKLEQEVRAELRERNVATREKTDAAIEQKLNVIERRLNAERVAEGWTPLEDGCWIPPGWVRAENIPAALAWPGDRGEQTSDSV